ncbi:MAG TPA: hypothetical protein VK716_14245 [Terracidiphilus sp.]|jgi:uncharacterized membrane protein|nr:hypothetical protein [Terracidiphilus sp.]
MLKAPVGTISLTPPRTRATFPVQMTRAFRSQQPALTLFALGLIALGIVALLYGDFAMTWQPVPQIPFRTPLAYAAGVLELALGIALLIPATTALATRILFPYLVLWTSLKLPSIVAAPKVEGVWLGLGELTLFLAGGWTLFAHLGDLHEFSLFFFATGQRSARLARRLFAVSLIPIGLSHFIYAQATTDLVPAWMPFRHAWAYIIGAGQIASGFGLLFNVLPRPAAWAEAIQISLYTLLIWMPAAASAPHTQLSCTACAISWTFGAAAWAVAQNTPAQTQPTFAP